MKKIDIKEYGLTEFHCKTCSKLLAVIPDEFLNKINPPCRTCQGWEVNYNFGIYLLRIDSKRYDKYMELQEELS